MQTPLRWPCWISLAIALLVISPTAHAGDGFEIIPSAGIGKPTGRGSDNYNSALNLSLSLGGRFNQLIALHGQVAYDRLGMDDFRGVSRGGYVARVLVVPSLHWVVDRFDLSIAPTLGLFVVSSRFEALSQQGESTVRGRQLGAQVMILYALNRTVALGPTISYARMWATKFCTRVDAGAEACDGAPESHGEGFWNAGLAARF